MKKWLAGGSFVLMFGGGLLAAGPSSVQGTVRGDDGKPMKTADVRLEAISMKMAPVVGKTDDAGRYRFANLEAGTYKVTVLSGTTVRGFIDGVRVNGTKRLDFDIKQASTGKPAKKAKHYVYVSDQTGTHIGGHWVEVPDNGGMADDQRVDTMSAHELQQIQNRTGNAMGGH